MGKVSFSLDAEQEAFVNERVMEGAFVDAGEYFRELVRRDQEHRQATEDLGRMLDEAEASGVCEDSLAVIWSEAEQEYAQKLEGLRSAIREGIESGVSDRTVEDVWEQARERHRAKHG